MKGSFAGSRAGGIALALLLLAGCTGPDPAVPGGGGPSGGPSKPGGPIKLLFVTNSNSDWWSAVEKGMQDGGKEFGCQVELRRNDKETPGQIRLLEDALSLGDIQGVAVSAYQADAPGISDKLRELKKQGKVVICIDSDVADTYADVREAYIGTVNFKAGEVAGRAAKALRPDGGKVVGFVGTSSAANARERLDGFFAGAGDKFARTEVMDDNSDPGGKAHSNVQTAISKHPDVGVLLGIWSYNGPAIAEEVSKAPEVRKTANVVTFDLDEQAVAHIEQGHIDVSVCQNPYEMGYQGVKLLKALITKDEKTKAEVLPDGKMRDTGVRVIVPKADSPAMKAKGETQDDVITIEEMKAWLKSKGLKSS
ncbi:MAG: substrate-binding domain-containing protein [Isosphaeraceae bacterium]